jgi:hypothetical protein
MPRGHQDITEGASTPTGYPDCIDAGNKTALSSVITPA